MARNQQIYNIAGIFAGPAHASGYHFLSTDSTLTNNPDSGSYYNLLFPIRRVQSCSYSINPIRT
ncbi:MAG: hypothetical protein AABY22_08230, partial [Nanoarchaeota archaeon]